MGEASDLTLEEPAPAAFPASLFQEDGTTLQEWAADHPEYGWHENKGYGAPDHLAALRSLGPTVLHRQSWRLPASPVASGSPATCTTSLGTP